MKKITLLDCQSENYVYRIGFNNPMYWYYLFGYKGLLSWVFCYANLKTAYFNYEGKTGHVGRKGFQVCILGLQFGYCYKYDDFIK